MTGIPTESTHMIRLNDDFATHGTLEIQMDSIEVTSISESFPDMSWEFVDSQKHWHAWDAKGELPTLEAKAREEPCSDPDNCGCDGYPITIYHCRICGEIIQPAWISTGPIRKFIPGRQTWKIMAQTARLMVGETCTVRSYYKDRVFFGVGRVIAARAQPGHPLWLEIMGIGPLGERPA